MTSIVNSTGSSANSAAVAASSTASTGSGSGTTSLTGADFLQLLTAQLKYQTPTNPADPTQMAEEFASISTVDGINQLNTQLTSLASSNSAATLAEASSLVGKQVAVSGNSITANGSGTAEGAFSLPSASASTTVTILNENGSVADTLNLGALSAGQQDFSWSGGTAGDSYTYNVTAADASGAAISATPYSVYDVLGVNITSGAPTLNVAGSDTALPVSSVQTILGASS